ncbi:MAG: DUF4838 domain-containing protein, partial [Lentisphaerae bacterium]|nr:DUF4838 domain-containing protein [Lentisphaerota bacterium]
ANAEIVIAEKPARTVRLAADDLQNYIQKMTDARLPIVTEPSGEGVVKLFVGRSLHTDKLGVTAEGLKHGAYRLVSGDDWLVFIGDDTDFVPPKIWSRRGGTAEEHEWAQQKWEEAAGGPWWIPAHARLMWKQRRRIPATIGLPDAAPSPGNKRFEMWTYDERGSYNAVAAFLRDLGVRWLLPGELGEIVPRMKSIALPRIDRTVRPDFEIRAFSHNMGDWTYRLGARAPYRAWTVHGVSLLQRPEIFAAHPEWFAMYGGKRDIKQFCYSSEELFQEMTRCVRAQFDVYDVEGVSVMPPDAFISMCQCPLCEGKEDLERPQQGRHSDYVWGFVNRVAKEIAKTHPGKLIYCVAYNRYRLPPKNIAKLEPNVQVSLCNGRFRPNDPPAAQAEFRAWRESWLPLTDRPLEMFENTFFGGSYYMPSFAARTVGQDINDTKGVSRGEGVHLFGIRKDRSAGNNAFNAFQIYFTARMYWGGKEQDPAALLDEYCRLLYGPAGDVMKTFFNYCETNWSEMEKDKEKIDAALALFDEAKAKVAPESVEARRLAPLDQFLNGLRMKSSQLDQKRGVVPQLRLVGEPKDIVIDGQLDEPFWKKINPGSVGRLRDAQTGRWPALGTTVKTGWSDNDLYFAVRCEEVPGEKPNVTAIKSGDMAIFYGDTVEILLETPMHSYYQIAVNPAGAVCDLDRAEGIAEWDSMAEVATHVADDHWTAEIRIPVTDNADDPLHQVVGRPPSISLPWFVNICRQRKRENGVEHSALSPTGKGFHVPLSFAHLYTGLCHKFEADPTVTNYMTAVRAAKKLPKTEALTALVALVDGSQGQLSDLQQSDALKQAASEARRLKDYTHADELAARIPVEAVKKTVIMQNLLDQRKAAEVIAKFGEEDFGSWPFWAAGEGYYARGRAYDAVGDRARAKADFKAALPLIGDPRVQRKMLKISQAETGKVKQD